MISRSDLKKALDDWTAWFWAAEKFSIERRQKIVHPLEHALALIGVRRCGKTYSAVSLAERFKEGTVFYFNFEDPIFYQDNSVRFLDELISIFVEYNRKTPEWVILDEIQNIAGWERWVRKQVDLKRFKIVLTGSSSKLLSSELATAIAGRCHAVVVWPLSFAEYLDFTQQTPVSSDEFLAALRDYMAWGGFPEVVLKADPSEKLRILSQYLNDIVLKDVISRHQLRHKRALDQILLHYFTNPSSLHSYSSLKKAYGIGTDTSAEYTGYLNEAFLVFEVTRFHPNLKVQSRDPKKIYVIDTGLRNIYARSPEADYGKLAENIVFLELMRRGGGIHYFRHEATSAEVDFIKTDLGKPISAIQVCYSNLENKKTYERETQALLTCLESLHLSSGLILTKDREESITLKDKKIKLIPLYRWLMEELPG